MDRIDASSDEGNMDLSASALYIVLAVLMPLMAFSGYQRTKTWRNAVAIWLLFPVAMECLIWGVFLIDSQVQRPALLPVRLGVVLVIGIVMSIVGVVGYIIDITMYRLSYRASRV